MHLSINFYSHKLSDLSFVSRLAIDKQHHTKCGHIRQQKHGDSKIGLSEEKRQQENLF
jgi:hypothetical protein